MGERATRRAFLLQAAAFPRGPLRDSSETYLIRSPHQLYDCPLRVLRPKRAPRSVVYVLPVNPDINYRWGDGLQHIQELGLHEEFRFAAAAPSFSDWPWFADHPTNPRIHQETYFVRDVVPLVDRLFSGLPRLLLGFSKSGNGAVTLLLRHPTLFHSAAAFDAPFMKEAPDQFGMEAIYGTQANFAQYEIPRLLAAGANSLHKGRPRFVILGHNSFGGPMARNGQHIERMHDLLDQLKIPHSYENSMNREHRWDSGWVRPALERLTSL